MKKLLIMAAALFVCNAGFAQVTSGTAASADMLLNQQGQKKLVEAPAATDNKAAATSATVAPSVKTYTEDATAPKAETNTKLSVGDINRNEKKNPKE